MATQKKTTAAELSELEKIAQALDSLATEAKALGEASLAKSIDNAAKKARNSDKQRAKRIQKFGSIVAALKAKGLSNDEIIERLTGENGGEAGVPATAAHRATRDRNAVPPLSDG